MMLARAARSSGDAYGWLAAVSATSILLWILVHTAMRMPLGVAGTAPVTLASALKRLVTMRVMRNHRICHAS